MPILGNFPGGGGSGGGGGLQLSPVSDIKTLSAAGKVYVKWTDPEDMIVSGVTLAAWAGTLLIRKAGSAPTSRRDGVIVLDSKNKNAYQNEYFCDSGLTDGVTYYYKFFPYSATGTYTESDADAFNVTPNPVLLGNVSGIVAEAAGNGKLSIKWNDPESTVVNDGVMLATWASTVLVVKEGDYATSPTDPAAAFTYTSNTLNGHATTPVVADNLTNGTTYYITLFPMSTDNAPNTNIANRATGIPNRLVVPAVPSQKGALTYNGTSQTPEWNNYDTSKMTVSVNGQIDAGTYDATFTLYDDYCWSLEDNNPKVIQWTIDKKAGTLTTIPENVVLDKDHLTGSFEIGGEYDGTISIEVNAGDNLFSAQLTGTTVNITCGEKQDTGSGTITVKCTDGKNYAAPTDKVVKVDTKFVTIYGVKWDGTSQTKLTRTDASALYEDPVPALSNGTGSSPFDDKMPWSGMVVETDAQAGELVKIPKFWYKLTQNGTGVAIQIADNPVEGFSVSPAHMDRGDGKKERDYVYIGRYHCANSNWKSITGTTPKVNVTRSAARSGIKGLGTGIYQMDFAMRFTIWLLYIVEFADWDSQSKIGYGCAPNGSTSAVRNMGYTDAGKTKYHTGTDQAARTTYGGTQYRYIEGLWDNCYDWLDGCFYSSAGLNIILNPEQFSDTTNSYTKVAGTLTGGYPSELKVSDAGGFPIFMPSKSSGSNTTYIPDYWVFGASSPCLRCGGSYGQNLGRGLFYVGYNGVSDSSGSIGCRLQKLP